MRTDTVVLLRNVAVKAQQSKPAILRETLLAQPGVEVSTSTSDFTAMLYPIIMHMIYGQNFWSILTAARAHALIGVDDFLTKFGIPVLMVSFLTTLKAYILTPITIRTKQLKALLRKVILSQPLIETSPIASILTMLRAIIFYMVYRKKCRVRLATHDTSTAIYGKHFITKLIHITLRRSSTNAVFPTQQILLRPTLLTKATLMRGENKALQAKTLISSTNICRNTHSALARLAVKLQTVLRTLLLPKAGSRKPLLAPGAKLLSRNVRNVVLRYNIIHETPSRFFIAVTMVL